MFKNRPGFSLLELLATITISAIIFGVVSSILLTVQKGTSSYYNLTENDKSVSMAFHYMFRDLSGVFVPKFNPDGKDKIVKNCLEIKIKDENIESINFITNIQLPVYGSKIKNIIKATYKVEKKDDFYQLLRSDDLDINSEKEHKYYPILNNISSIKFEAAYYKKDKNNKELLTKKSWSSTQRFEEKERPYLPEQIKLTLETPNDTFTLIIPVYAFNSEPYILDKKQNSPAEMPKTVVKK